mmetsp:Transcript_11603/g.27793  ORF Transcript_11603/g.27793 Transcript_11603/m.27793 type:complete len:214 (-) Transcript_11603:1652-2293(-)
MLIIFLSPPSLSSVGDCFENPTDRRTARHDALSVPIFEAITLLSSLIVLNLVANGALIMLLSSVRMSLAAPSTSATVSSLTNSSSLSDTRSVSLSRAENENEAAPAVFIKLFVNSSYFPSSELDTGGENLAAPNRPIIKFFIMSSDFGIPWNIWTIFPSRTPNTVGRAVTSNASLIGRSLSELTLTKRNIPPAFLAMSSNAGPRTLHGPHQSA